MKIHLLTWTLLCLGIWAHAQESYKSARTTSFNLPEKYLQFELSAGVNFDLMHRGSDQGYDLLSTKPNAVPALGMKLTHFCAPKWGWYTQVQLNFYTCKRAEGIWGYTPDEFFGDLAKALLAPVFITRPSIDFGMVYRIETVRWRLHPQVGVGWFSYLEPKNMERSRTVKQENVSMKYIQRATPMLVNVGLSLNYFLNDRCYLFLNGNFQQPIQKSWAGMSYWVDGMETSNIKQRSGTAGRNINLHAGFGFCPWIKR